MKRHFTYRDIPVADKGAAVAIGNFDGVHLGHQSVLALARAAAADISAPVGIVTFEPHPRSFFQPDAPPFRLMNSVAKANRLNKLGVEFLYEIPFNAELAALTADEFIKDVLVDGLGVRHVVVGADFRFGAKRSGDAEVLKSKGRELDFGTTIVPLVSDGQGDFSSTAIRKALESGLPAEAARMLGHWHRIDGVVSHGHKRGRDLGYPTANVGLEGLHQPKYGVYAVLIDIKSGPHAGSYKGAASLGVKPTFGVHAPSLETYIFDFAGDIYGQDVSVALVEYLRPEETFQSLEALTQQMQVDCDNARSILQNC